MGRFTRKRRHRQTDDVPLCIFPRGRKAGIKCSSVQVIKTGGRTVSLCNETMCCYHDPIPVSPDTAQVVELS